jgi:hypothetical protein
MPSSLVAAAPLAHQDAPPLIGLSALARKAMRGETLAGIANSLLARLTADSRDAAALLDLSTIEQLLGSDANRLSLQARALDISRTFVQPAPAPDALRLLVLMAPGNFMANTPIEFLLEGSHIRMEFFYVEAGMDIIAAAPPHDAAFVAVAESSVNQPILKAIAEAASQWPRPLVNGAESISRLTRDGAWRLLHDVAGVVYPNNEKVSRSEAAAADDFPLIMRPVDSHAGEGLEKIDDEAALADYLARHGEDNFYLAPFIDYRGGDRLFRKMRIAVVDGAPYAVHLAISPRWMIHYLNADMIENVANRAEEAQFLAGFDGFARRHAETFALMREKLELDYFQIDCAEIENDKLLVFEVGSAMIAHDLDDPRLFPYKSAPMQKLFGAFRAMIASRVARSSEQAPA